MLTRVASAATGQEDYAHIRPLSYDGVDVFLLCFSVDNRDSFENAEAEWYKELKAHCPKSPFLLVGCKSDLRSGPEPCVGRDEADALATKLGAYSYFECSAKNKTNVTEVRARAVAAVSVACSSRGERRSSRRQREQR